MLIDPLAYLGDTIDKIFYMIIDVAEEGKKEDFSKLEEKVIWAIELRDCLTYKEKDAINKALSSKYIEFIRTGDYLDEIKNYIDEAKDLIKDSYEEEREEANEELEKEEEKKENVGSESEDSEGGAGKWGEQNNAVLPETGEEGQEDFHKNEYPGFGDDYEEY